MFNSWKYDKCTCGLGYPLEEECECGVQDKAKEFFRKRFEALNKQKSKVSFKNYILIHLTETSSTSIFEN